MLGNDFLCRIIYLAYANSSHNVARNTTYGFLQNDLSPSFFHIQMLNGLYVRSQYHHLRLSMPVENIIDAVTGSFWLLLLTHDESKRIYYIH